MNAVGYARAAADAPVAPLMERLVRAQVAGCTCLTKTPELRFHDPHCTYRLVREAGDDIERLRGLLRRAYLHHTATSLPLAVARFGSRDECAAEGGRLWREIASELLPPTPLPDHGDPMSNPCTPTLASAGNLPSTR